MCVFYKLLCGLFISVYSVAAATAEPVVRDQVFKAILLEAVSDRLENNKLRGLDADYKLFHTHTSMHTYLLDTDEEDSNCQVKEKLASGYDPYPLPKPLPGARYVSFDILKVEGPLNFASRLMQGVFRGLGAGSGAVLSFVDLFPLIMSPIKPAQDFAKYLKIQKKALDLWHTHGWHTHWWKADAIYKVDFFLNARHKTRQGSLCRTDLIGERGSCLVFFKFDSNFISYELKHCSGTREPIEEHFFSPHQLSSYLHLLEVVDDSQPLANTDRPSSQPPQRPQVPKSKSPEVFSKKKVKKAPLVEPQWWMDTTGKVLCTHKRTPSIDPKEWIDTTAPRLKAAVIEEEVFLGDKVRIRIQAEDVGSGTDKISGVDRIECQHKGRSIACSVAEGLSISTYELGPDSAKLWAVDKAGNTSKIFKVFWFVKAKKRPIVKPTPKLIDVVQNVRIEGRDLDVLFVMDNSDSMREEQAELASKIGGFLSTLQDVNYHIGITTTDLHKLNRPGTDGRLFPLKDFFAKKYIDRSMNIYQAPQYLADILMRIGTQGSLSEDGIGAVVRMLERWRDGDADIVNFLRPEAHLSVVVISDANSIASKPHHTPTGVIRLVRRTWPNKKIVWNSIVATMQSVRTPGCTFEALGRQYESLSSRTSGIIGSICDPSYTNILSQMGQRVLNMHKSFLLECEVAELKTGFKFSVWRKNLNDTYGYYKLYNVGFKIEYDEVLLSDFLPEGEYQFRFQCFE